MVWEEEILNKIITKLDKTSISIGSKIPYTTMDGVCTDKIKDDIYWWTNGFWPGILWHMFKITSEAKYKIQAEECELTLDKALYGFEGLHHDVGFMWLLSAVANFRITNNLQSQKRGLIAAQFLAARYNIKGQFIRAWNANKIGWSIIDTMMNLPLLYWASEETNDPRYRHIAESHTHTVIKYFVRKDGSVNHIVIFDPVTGEFVETLGGQGYGVGSSWSRGQSWALYGFVLAYLHTKNESYLDTAKNIANYFIANIPEDGIPSCDFRAPNTPVVKDGTAGAIASCALIYLSRLTTEYEADFYLKPAVKMIQSLAANSDWTTENELILNNGTEAYHNAKTRHIPIIYGDYFFIEAVSLLNNYKHFFW